MKSEWKGSAGIVRAYKAHNKIGGGQSGLPLVFEFREKPDTQPILMAYNRLRKEYPSHLLTFFEKHTSLEDLNTTSYMPDGDKSADRLREKID